MLVNSLEQMESIVSNNRSLSWDGWNVVELTRSNSAAYKDGGAFVGGAWYFKTTFIPDRDGWRIPKKYVR